MQIEQTKILHVSVAFHLQSYCRDPKHKIPNSLTQLHLQTGCEAFPELISRESAMGFDAQGKPTPACWCKTCGQLQIAGNLNEWTGAWSPCNLSIYFLNKTFATQWFGQVNLFS